MSTDFAPSANVPFGVDMTVVTGRENGDDRRQDSGPPPMSFRFMIAHWSGAPGGNRNTFSTACYGLAGGWMIVTEGRLDAAMETGTATAVAVTPEMIHGLYSQPQSLPAVPR